MATPSLAMIPSGYKASKVYSVLPESGVGDFDFTRATTATRVNSSGLIEEMAINVPRLEYPLIDGVVNGCPSLLLEPQRTNLLAYSEDFSNSYWTKSGASISSDIITSPDGSLNADKIVEDTSTAGHTVFRNSATVTLASHTFSCFVKTNGRNIKLDFFGGNNNAIFNLTSGIVISTNGTGLTAKIEKLLNGWYRCSITQVQTATTIYPNILCVDNSNNSTYQGDGTSGVYLWGAMLEQGSFQTSYIPTNGSTTTRNAETCNGAGDAATFNDSEGVLMVEMNRFKQSGVTDYLSFGIFDSSGNNAVAFKFRNSLNVFYASIESTLGSPRTDLNYTFNDLSSSTKILVKYKTNDFALWVNGFKVVTDSSGYVPTGLNQLKFSNFSNSEPFNGNTKQVQYYNSALTESELEKLTSWTSFSDMANAQQYTII